jgi:prefoldin subunit 5
VDELREQIEYQHAEMETLEHNLEKYQQALEVSEIELGSCKETIEKLCKEGNEAK